MNELLQKNDESPAIRWKLLAGVSVLALGAYISSTYRVEAEDADRPTVWIELDGQFSQQNDGVEPYVPSFMLNSRFDAAAHAGLERGPATIWDKGGKITFQPKGSEWRLSLGVRYGKSSRAGTINHQTAQPTFSKYGYPAGFHKAYQLFDAQASESHTIVDFQVGRDVGIGRFGRDGISVLSVGVRIAQLNSRSAAQIQSQPTNVNAYYYYHIHRANFDAKRTFTDIGPSISWDASASIVGNPSSSIISFDWGANVAILFGRQHATSDYQATDNYKHNFQYLSVAQVSGGGQRRRSVVVPNLGGFAAISWHYTDAKVSLGYRADYFFGAIDGGLDGSQSFGRGFHGPFASINVGLGG
jgi:hypothetical protein